jgi:hypothetical protein
MDKLKSAKYLPNWTYIGDTTIYESERVTNEKLLLKQTRDFLSQQ